MIKKNYLQHVESRQIFNLAIMLEAFFGDMMKNDKSREELIEIKKTLSDKLKEDTEFYNNLFNKDTKFQ